MAARQLAKVQSDQWRHDRGRWRHATEHSLLIRSGSTPIQELDVDPPSPSPHTATRRAATTNGRSDVTWPTGQRSQLAPFKNSLRAHRPAIRHRYAIRRGFVSRGSPRTTLAPRPGSATAHAIEATGACQRDTP